MDTKSINARYIDLTTTAKMIRKALATNFPGVKFSVKSDRYAGGSSIRINWTDGPTRKQVDAITDGFAGSGFDGMSDYKYSRQAWLLADGTAIFAQSEATGSQPEVISLPPTIDAELVRFCVDFVFTSRNYSESLLRRLIDRACRKTGVSMDSVNVYVYDDGRASYSVNDYNDNYHVSKVIHNSAIINNNIVEYKN